MKIKKAIVGIALVAASLTACGFDKSNDFELVSESYTVKSGDTLWDISSKYIEKNTYGKRDIREFTHGIIELNYDEVFKDRKPGEIHVGDDLKINYFVKKEHREEVK